LELLTYDFGLTHVVADTDSDHQRAQARRQAERIGANDLP